MDNALSALWLTYCRLFKEAEYTIKICEHLDVELNNAPVEELRQSALYAAKALKQWGEGSPKWHIRLRSAIEHAKSARKTALLVGSTIVGKQAAEALKICTEHRDIAARQLIRLDEHEEAWQEFSRALDKASHMRRMSDEFATHLVEQMKKISDFLDAYYAVDNIITSAIHRQEESLIRFTLQTLGWTIAGIALPYMIKCGWEWVKDIMERMG